MTTSLDWNLPGSLVLLGEVGSGAHGLALEGKDDRDLMGVCVPAPEYVVGLRHFEQFTKRDQPQGVKAEPGDLEVVVYSLQKWTRLALNGNPSILLLGFIQPEVITTTGRELQEMMPKIVSREAGPRFLGYLHSQKQRLLGEKGQASLPNRGDNHRTGGSVD